MDVIDNVYQEVVDCIASFAAGVTINCCNDKCQNEITFVDVMEFENNIDIDDRKIYKYTMWDLVTFKNLRRSPVTLSLFGKECRVFCYKCVKSKRLKSCRYCYHKDVVPICADHPEEMIDLD